MSTHRLPMMSVGEYTECTGVYYDECEVIS